MRYSQLLAKTLRETPETVKAASYQLLLRGGFIRPLAQGLYSFLPLGQRVIRNVKRIISEEMEALGGQEVAVPLVNPLDIWNRSGRDELIHGDMVQFSDRIGHNLVLSPTHEEAMVELVRASLHSYRDLPVFLFQFQSKFRDEERPRCGLVRTKEFLMKDGYSFHRSFTDLNNFFPRMFAAYTRIFERCGVPVTAAQAGVGYMGGDRSFEFLMASECGDDYLVECENCGYKANTEVAVGVKDIEAGAPLEMEKVYTPGCRNMSRLGSYLELPGRKLAKSMVFATSRGLVMAVVRGDHEVSLEKLSQAVKLPILRFATVEELTEAGLVPGYFSPLGLERPSPGGKRLLIVADDAITDSPNLVYGANETDYHYVNVNFGRDLDADRTGDIARIAEGTSCVHCGTALSHKRVMELGHIFRLGDFYSRAMELFVHEERGKKIYPYMGSYGIGLGRLISGIVEANHDEGGIVWPHEIAPFKYYVMSIGKSAKVTRVVEYVYENLAPGALIDDRHESISVKFKDADLLGLPYRVVISGQTISNNEVEVMDRSTRHVRRVPLTDLPLIDQPDSVEKTPG